MCRPRHTDGPVLRHGQILCTAIGQFQRDKRIVNGIFTIRNNVDHRSFYIGRHHTFVHNGVRFRNFCYDITAVEILPLFNSDMSLPFLLAVQRVYADAAGDERTSG